MERIHESIREKVYKLEQRFLEESANRFPRGLPESVDANFDLVKKLIQAFRLELKNLIFFVHCIQKWSDASRVVPILGPTVSSIEASLRSISVQLTEEVHRVDQTEPPQRGSLLDIHRKKKEIRYLEQRASELVEVLSSVVSNVKSLKPKIRPVFRFLSKQRFQSCSPLCDFDGWQDFVYSTKSSLESINGNPIVTGVIERKQQLFPGLTAQISCFNQTLYAFRIFLGHLLKTAPYNPETERVMIYFGSVVVRAALVYCECWFMGMDPDLYKMKDMANTLLDLQLKIDFVTPDFVDMNLQLLKGYLPAGKNVNDEPVNLLVECLIGSRNLKVLYMELTGLIKQFICLSEGHTKDLVRFSVDVKQVIMRVRTLQTILQKTDEASILVDLLAEIWLVKIEIFLRDQLSAPDCLLVNDLNRIQSLKEEMEIPVASSFPPEDNTEKMQPIMTLQEEMATVVASVCDSFHAKVTTTQVLKNVLLKLLIKIMLYKAKSSLVKLLSANGSLTDVQTDQIKSLTQGLKFLTIHVDSLPVDKLQDGKLVFNFVDEVCRRIITHDYSVPSNRIKDEILIVVPSLLDEIKLIRVQLKKIYFLAPVCKFPKTNGIGFLESLLRKMREWLSSKHVLTAHFKHLVEEILASLEFLTYFLKDRQGRDFEVKDLAEHWTSVLNLAYEIEYVFDLMFVGIGAEWHNLIWVYHLLEDARHLKLEVSIYHKKITNEVKGHNAFKTPSQTISQDKTSGLEMHVVVLKDQEEAIIDRITKGSLQQDIVSIIGMPGIGKTTLARIVYNNLKVQHHFHVRAWCYVSQRYEKRRLLLNILSHVVDLTDNLLEMTDEDLELQLYQRLKGKRFLVVMDDMWNISAWEDLRRSLPVDGNGSRILMTSRLRDLALKIKTTSDPHLLRLLSDDESWDLLRMKIFYDEYCPEDLEIVSKEITKNCKGLPLSVVAMAGVLERTDKRLALWKQIAQRLSSLILNDPYMRCMDILELSYNHLPDHLKACYLYFGALSEDKDIRASKLIRLWMAEGFVQNAGSNALEDIAESYLMDLIGRSLVTVTKGRSNGGVKACRIHDLLLDLCYSKAKEENFFRLFTRYEEPYATFHGLDCGLDLDSGYPSDVTFDDYRVVVRAKRKHFILSRPSGPGVRSLQFYASADLYPRCPYDFSFISDNFKLLKVLDVECINIGVSFPQGLESLIHLRYLAISGDIDSVPSYVSNLQNLETFLVSGLKGRVVLPDTLWCMTRLRHLQVNNHAVFSLQDEMPDNFCRLDNLVTLSSPQLFWGEETQKMTMRLPNLRKLRCIVSESRAQYTTSCFPKLDLLSQLESLAMTYYGRALSCFEFTLPVSLKKLTLSNFRLPWNHISGIGRLENLEVLKLCRAFEGETWYMIEGEFSKLKFLKLDSLDIVQWNACSDHLPNLQKLVLRKCRLLEGVPSSFGDIPTLQAIELCQCAPSCEESLRRIQEEVEGLKIIINLSCSDVN